MVKVRIHYLLCILLEGPFGHRPLDARGIWLGREGDFRQPVTPLCICKGLVVVCKVRFLGMRDRVFRLIN